uniref:Uncharacterized protein n=1 Tax=Ascaris lumbricoides TaxID=6252 RepID=A0A0M3IUB0_ASCLU
MQFSTAFIIPLFLIITSIDDFAESSPSSEGWGGSSGTGWSSSPAGSFGGSSASGWGATFHTIHPLYALWEKNFDTAHAKSEGDDRPKMKNFTAWILQ